MASGHRKGHLAAGHRGLVEREGAEGGSGLELGPSPALPCASSRSGPPEEGAAGSAQMEGQSTDHETEASWDGQGNGRGSSDGRARQAELSSEGNRVPPTAPSLCDA